MLQFANVPCILAEYLNLCLYVQERSQIIATYALCGFSNFSSIGIQIGGLGPMAPNRKSDLATLALRALLAGTLACFMTACVAGKVYYLTTKLTNSLI